MSGGFDHYDKVYVQARVEYYVRGVVERIIPCFSDLESDAKEFERERYQQLQESPGIDPENVVEGELEERAFDDSIEYYISMHWLKQQTINNATAGLYHLWEKDLKAHLIRTIVKYGGADLNEIQKADFDKLVEILKRYGFNFEAQQCFANMNELRLIANVAKHGAGSSLTDLTELRPDFFRKSEIAITISPDPEDLEITEDQFIEFTETVQQFWDTYDISLRPVS